MVLVVIVNARVIPLRHCPICHSGVQLVQIIFNVLAHFASAFYVREHDSRMASIATIEWAQASKRSRFVFSATRSRARGHKVQYNRPIDWLFGVAVG